MSDAIFLVLGLVVGAVVGWLWSSSRGLRQRQSDQQQGLSAQAELQAQAQAERELRITAETRQQETEKRIADQTALVVAVEAQLGNTFKALSSDALQQNSQSFVESAKLTVGPLQETLKRFEVHLREVESARQQAYGSLDQQLKNLLQSEQQLQRETGSLVTALRRPEVRGRWGEVTLRRVVELAGMTEHCDFSEQVRLDGDSSTSRPDLVVHLPGEIDIVVDAKVSLDAYLDAVNAAEEDQRQACMDRHCQQLRQHISSLAAKSYWSKLDSAPEFVVMFVPGESFLSAAAATDLRLMEDGMQKGVFLATPITLIVLLKTAAHGWRQERMARSAEETRTLGGELHDRVVKFLTHMTRLRRQLDAATGAFNDAVGSLESRILPTVRRFKELGAAAGADLPELEPIDTKARQLAAPEAPENE